MRNVYRHPNNQGSVIEFDMFGKAMRMFVPDAKFRPAIPCVLGPRWIKPEGNIKLPKLESRLTDIPNGCSDEELQALYPELKEDGTGAENTAKLRPLYGDEESYDLKVGHPCRIASNLVAECQYFGVQACIPNLYELLVIRAEADKLDAMDPTAAEYSGLAMKGFKNYFNDDRMSSTVYNGSAMKVDWQGHVHGTVQPGRKYEEDGYAFGYCLIIPVIEKAA